MTNGTKELADVMAVIRKCFNQMKALSDELHEPLGVTSSMRSVLEYLSAHGSDTVPRIARQKGVTRQHIQTIMNVLLEQELVESVENPAHKRSTLFRLTSGGEAAYAEVAAAEQAPLKRMLANLENVPINEAWQALEAFSEQLDLEFERASGKQDRNVR
jgi:DNA-binding MarR family transcriptional regulator